MKSHEMGPFESSFRVNWRLNGTKEGKKGDKNEARNDQNVLTRSDVFNLQLQLDREFVVSCLTIHSLILVLVRILACQNAIQFYFCTVFCHFRGGLAFHMPI